MSRTCGERPPALASSCAALLDAEAVLLVDHDQAEGGEGHPFLDQGVGADDDRRLARRDRPRAAWPRPSALSEPVRSVDRRSPSVRRAAPPTVARCWRASRSVGARRAPWRPARAAAARAYAATAVLPDPTSPWSSRSIGVGAGEVARGWRRSRRPGRRSARSAGRRARRSPSTSAARMAASAASSIAICGAASRTALPAPRDHPELEGEELVEGEPAERGVAVLERRPGSGPPRGRRRSAPAAPRARIVGRQVLRVGEAGLVERLADGRSAGGPRSGRPSVGRSARSGRRGATRASSPTIWNSGLSRVSRRPKCLSLPETTISAPDEQPAFDEAPSEPRRIDRSLSRPRAARSSAGCGAGTRLDADVADRRLGRDDRAVRGEAQIADLAHLAQVVVAAGQMEQEIADGVEVELDPGPPELGARAPDRSRPAAVDRSSTGSVGAACADERRSCWPRPYSAEMRYR